MKMNKKKKKKEIKYQKVLTLKRVQMKIIKLAIMDLNAINVIKIL